MGARAAVAGVVALGALLLASACTTGPYRVDALAKVQGWRDDGSSTASPVAVIEIAPDRQTAEAMWNDTVPTDLPTTDAVPHDPGVYGDLDDVDFDHQVVVLISSGESSSCPMWISTIATGDDDTIAARTQRSGNTCTADFSYYREIVAVDRDALPPTDELADATVTVDGGWSAAAQGARLYEPST